MSSALSTHSLDDLPDSGLSVHKTPAKSVVPTGTSDSGNQVDGNLEDSRISCSTFGSPVQDESFAKKIVKEPNFSPKFQSPFEMVQMVDVQKKCKVEKNNDDDDVTIIDSKPEIIALSSDDEEVRILPIV